jgi:hypothetical protein|tara:strand:+ start:968 stop:1117 length:150 start_codon:yes stop_codon:yes gene_type:complete
VGKLKNSAFYLYEKQLFHIRFVRIRGGETKKKRIIGNKRKEKNKIFKRN